LFVTYKFNDILNELKTENKGLNLFNVLIRVEENNDKNLNDDWQLLKDCDDTVLFNQIIAEQGNNITLRDVIDYLLSSGSRYAALLSNYLIQDKDSIDAECNFLVQYGYNLRELKYQPCLHREDEQKMIKICLNREYKNNIMLVGSPGVGKTFLIASIAHIMNLDIYYIDISNVLSGTKYRGEFEKKLHEILTEAVLHNKILFFDEIHMMMSTGNTDGGISGADILKPYLMNNKVKIIGATTLEEFSLFSHDKAFERRFNLVYLNELTSEHTKDIIKSAFKQTVDWDQLVINQIFTYLDNDFESRKYPDKAIDFFDFYFAGEKLSFFNNTEIAKAIKCFSKMNIMSV
jgi:ATP-dependent Clp protease ATP-binding subunit ClpC